MQRKILVKLTLKMSRTQKKKFWRVFLNKSSRCTVAGCGIDFLHRKREQLILLFSICLFVLLFRKFKFSPGKMNVFKKQLFADLVFDKPDPSQSDPLSASWVYQRNKQYLCTGASLYAPYSLLLISNKFWMGGGEGGESEGEKRGTEKRGY
jgi:hypothetical protein